MEEVMDKYIFNCNHNKKNRALTVITMEHYIDNILEENKLIGDIYNLVDYINYSSFDNSDLLFNNFKGNQMEFVVSAISRYKNIVKVNGYDHILISNKRSRIRG